MDPFTVALVASAGVSIYGNMMGNKAEKRARAANAAAYAQQRELARLATQRELDIFNTESAIFIGDHISSYAKAGVDLSGSALLSIAQDKTAVVREHQAIVMGATANDSMFRAKEKQERDEARRVVGFENTALQTAGSLLNAYTTYKTLTKKDI